MSIDQTLHQEIEVFKTWIELEKDDSTCKRDLLKRIEFINRVLEKIA